MTAHSAPYLSPIRPRSLWASACAWSTAPSSPALESSNCTGDCHGIPSAGIFRVADVAAAQRTDVDRSRRHRLEPAQAGWLALLVARSDRTQSALQLLLHRRRYPR